MGDSAFENSKKINFESELDYFCTINSVQKNTKHVYVMNFIITFKIIQSLLCMVSIHLVLIPTVLIFEPFDCHI